MENILSENEQSKLRKNNVISHQEIAIQAGDLLVAENVITRDRRVINTNIIPETRKLLKD
jgi:hypothetical protein